MNEKLDVAVLLHGSKSRNNYPTLIEIFLLTTDDNFVDVKLFNSQNYFWYFTKQEQKVGNLKLLVICGKLCGCEMDRCIFGSNVK